MLMLRIINDRYYEMNDTIFDNLKYFYNNHVPCHRLVLFLGIIEPGFFFVQKSLKGSNGSYKKSGFVLFLWLFFASIPIVKHENNMV